MQSQMEEDKDTYTVDEALNNLGFGYYQIFVFLYAGMGWISEAMEMMLLSFVGPAIQSVWGLSSHEQSLLTSVVFAGMLLGAYSWGIVSDTFGRRRGFLVTAMITTGAGFLSACAPNYSLLVILRGLVGVGLGGGPVLASWFLEFIPSASRGTWMVVFSAFWTVGTILEASIAWLIMPRLGWRWLLAASAFPSSLLLLFYGLTPESPRYLCMTGRHSDALVVLKKIARVNGRVLPSGVLVSDKCIELKENLNDSDEAEMIYPEDKLDVSDKTKLVVPEEKDSASPECTSSQKSGFSLLKRLLSPELVRSTLLLWIVFFGSAFSYYGLVLLTTELNNPHNECLPKELKSSNQAGIMYKDVFITSFAEFPGLLLSAAIVDRLGRKLSMASLFFLCFVFLLPLAFHLPQSLTTGLLFGARTCISGTFTIVYIYAPEVKLAICTFGFFQVKNLQSWASWRYLPPPEVKVALTTNSVGITNHVDPFNLSQLQIYPTSLRSTGVGVASSVGRIGGMVCPLVAVSLIHGCHRTIAIILFESVIILCGICVILFPFETRGLELSNS